MNIMFNFLKAQWVPVVMIIIVIAFVSFITWLLGRDDDEDIYKDEFPGS